MNLADELENAKREQKRCMGGVDPEGCIAASKRITELRLAMRDDTAFQAHLAKVLIQRPIGRPTPSPRSFRE